MTFEEWIDDYSLDHDLYDDPYEAAEKAWNAAIAQAAKLVAEKFDEQEPWIEEKDIRALAFKE
jgi:hypothetical protein